MNFDLRAGPLELEPYRSFFFERNSKPKGR